MQNHWHASTGDGHHATLLPPIRNVLSLFEQQHQPLTFVQIMMQHLDLQESATLQITSHLDNALHFVAPFPSVDGISLVEQDAAFPNTTSPNDWPVWPPLPLSDAEPEPMFAPSHAKQVCAGAASGLDTLAAACNADARSQFRKRKNPGSHKQRPSRPAAVLHTAETDAQPAKKPCQNAKEANLLVGGLGLLYAELLQPLQGVKSQQDILQEHAVRLKVTPTALRNILTFKSRTKDTKQFWSPPLWQLYRREHRCAICRGLPDTNRTLCPHYKSGRPRKDGAASTAGSGVGGAGEKGTDEAPDSARIRSYPIQIAIELVWAAIAGPDTAAVPPA